MLLFLIPRRSMEILVIWENTQTLSNDELINSSMKDKVVRQFSCKHLTTHVFQEVIDYYK